MKKTNEGFSIIFAIIITVIASSMSLYLLSFTIPYAKNVKGLENSSKAYYIANAGVENALWDKSQNDLGYEASDSFSGPSDYSYTIQANGSQIPVPGQGNSSFDTDWNTLGYSNPIQLSIGDAMIDNWGDVLFNFRVPDLDGDGDLTNQTLWGDTETLLLNWQLSSSSETLLPSNTGAFITSADINSSSSFNLGSRSGIDLDDNISTFSAFYSSNCGSTDQCTLKISAIGNLFMNDLHQTLIPYLEYQIDTTGQDIPTRFTNIRASGKSYGFRKNVDVHVPQLTTDQAFDFTIFQ